MELLASATHSSHYPWESWLFHSIAKPYRRHLRANYAPGIVGNIIQEKEAPWSLSPEGNFHVSSAIEPLWVILGITVGDSRGDCL